MDMILSPVDFERDTALFANDSAEIGMETRFHLGRNQSLSLLRAEDNVSEARFHFGHNQSLSLFRAENDVSEVLNGAVSLCDFDEGVCPGLL